MTNTTLSPPKRSLHIDLETFSDEPLPKCGVYRYAGSPAFEILLTSYAFDNEPIKTIDNACGEQMPQELLDALEDPNVIKIAQNAVFERVCFSRVLGHWLDPSQWRCSMVMASYLTLPLSLANVAVALNVTEQKMEEGKDLIRYFSVPCKPTKANGGRTRNYPTDAPDKWAVYKQYNAQDVETERAVVHELMKHPLPEHEWELYALDQRINDRGVRIDRLLVKQAIEVDKVFTEQAFHRAQELTGLENPGSVSQLKAWLADQDMPMESLAKKLVQEKAKETDGIVGELLNLRLELSKTSVKKYEAMARSVCKDGRVHGTLQFFGASRTGRWCLAEGAPILVKTLNNTVIEKPIEQVTTDDLVWDGEQWVSHEGVVFSGEHDVMTWDGVTATSKHNVFISSTQKVTLEEAKERRAPIWRGNTPSIE